MLTVYRTVTANKGDGWATPRYSMAPARQAKKSCMQAKNILDHIAACKYISIRCYMLLLTNAHTVPTLLNPVLGWLCCWHHLAKKWICKESSARPHLTATDTGTNPHARTLIPALCSTHCGRQPCLPATCCCAERILLLCCLIYK
jgi:hypothetical protein